MHGIEPLVDPPVRRRRRLAGRHQRPQRHHLERLRRTDTGAYSQSVRVCFSVEKGSRFDGPRRELRELISTQPAEEVGLIVSYDW